MGGAYAYRLKEKGHIIYGYDLNKDNLNYALDNNYIDYISFDLKEISNIDLLILATYPKDIIPFLNKYHHLFRDDLYITDIASVKGKFLLDAVKLAKPAKYISHHPMAGKEKTGIKYSKECEFSNANFLITTTIDNKEDEIELIKSIGVDLGFGNIVTVDYDKQDLVIAYTSALTHAIAISLVNSDNIEDAKNFIGDSYRDLTRIAMINENLWSELFFENKDNLLNYIDIFIKNMEKIKDALKNNDIESLKELMVSSTNIRKSMNK